MLGSGEAVKRAIGTRYPDREGWASTRNPHVKRMFCQNYIFDTGLTFGLIAEWSRHSRLFSSLLASLTEKASELRLSKGMIN